MVMTIRTLRAVDYYTEAVEESFGYYGEGRHDDADPPGIWTGELARRFFGDAVTVRREDFAALFFGVHPATGAPLTRTADQLAHAAWRAEEDDNQEEANRLRRALAARQQTKPHRAGIDLTFSAPKDFSLLVAAASPDERRRLLAAWQRSVEATLRDVERRFAKTRLRDKDNAGGQVRTEQVSGCAVAIFQHISARPVGHGVPPDPDSHIHAVMFSPVLHDETTHALFSNDIRLNMKMLGAEARARLANELRQAGYAVLPDRQPRITSFHLPGVTPALRARYSKRRGEILAGLEAGDYKKSSVAAIGTRQGKGDWQRGDALAAWRADFDQIGLTEASFRPTEDSEPMAMRSDAQVLNDLLAMQSYFSARDVREALWSEAIASAPEGIDIGQWVDERTNRMLASPDLLRVTLPDGSHASRQRTASGDDEPVFTTRSLLRRELALDDEVTALGKLTGHRIAWSKAETIVAAQEQRKTLEAQAEAIAKGKPLPEDFRWAYRDDQKAAMAKILAGPDIGFVQAYAGTGKTTAAAAMIEVWKVSGMKVIALAPSNKAAGQLSEDCGLTGTEAALTVDAFLLGKAKDGVDASSVIFIDEASMLSFDHAEALVKLARERGAKLVLQGDTQQLPSVPRGHVFTNWIEKRLGTDAAELTVITRQREEWAKRATEAAARGDFAATLALLDEHGQINTEGTDEAILDRLVRDHLADPQPIDQKLIVTSRNADIAKLNDCIRRELVSRGEVAEGLACFAGKDELRQIRLGAGDRIVFTDTLKSGRQKLAANGALGTVLAVHPAGEGLRVRVQLDGQRNIVEFDTKSFAAIGHSFAISIHKSQGQTVTNCRYYWSDFVSSELAFVAMSRHRDSFGLYCREDRKQDLAQWMGRRIEKLDARDIVSVADLNAAAAELRAQDESFAQRTQEFIRQRLPVVFKRVVAEVRKLSEVVWPTEVGQRWDGLLDELRASGRRMMDRARTMAPPQPAVATLDIAARVRAMRSGKNGPAPPKDFRM
jgi:conjugative relaxase-like TrwC/TraI family protein